jgi:hypothetical protein
MYIALLIISLIAGVGLIVLHFCFDIFQEGPLFGTLLILYSIYATVALCFCQTKEEDFEKYEKAKTEYEIIKNKCVDISTSTLVDYIDDIKEANKLIEKSKKWHNNWYLKNFYYKEIGELPVLELKNLI